MKVPGIRLSNGYELKYIIASGGLAYNSRKGWLWDYPLRWLGLLDETLFATVMKTGTFTARKGNFRWYNPLRCISFLPDGVVNAFGLTNPGLDILHCQIQPKIDAKKAKMIGSILGTPKEKAEMARRLNDIDFIALEDNTSCPNTGDDILHNSENVIRGLEAIKKVTCFEIIAKLSVVHDIPWIVERLAGLVAAIDINSVPWSTVFPDRVSPLARFGAGGVSGKAAQPHTWQLVKQLRSLTNIPIIGPSVWDYRDIDELIRIGASAISFGSILMPHPYRPLNPLRPTAYARRHMRENR